MQILQNSLDQILQQVIDFCIFPELICMLEIYHHLVSSCDSFHSLYTKPHLHIILFAEVSFQVYVNLV